MRMIAPESLSAEYPMGSAARTDADVSRSPAFRAVPLISGGLAVPINPRVHTTALEVNADPGACLCRPATIVQAFKVRGVFTRGTILLQFLQIENVRRLFCHIL
jgi:hypothetical protein